MDNLEKKYKPTNKDKINVSYYSELMQNYFPESIIDQGRGLKSINLGADRCILFFIDKDKQFWALIAQDGTDSGWTKMSLSPKDTKVTAFDIDFDEQKNALRIVQAQRTNNKSSLLVSNLQLLDKVDLNKFAENINWKQKKLIATNRIIDNIYAHRKGVLFSTQYKNTDATYFHFEYDKAPQKHTLPENSAKIKQLEVGRLYRKYGVFILYELGGKETMLFQGLIPDKYGHIKQERFDIQGNIEHFCLLPGKGRSDELYLAGDGVFRFTFDRAKATLETITKPRAGREFTKIDAAQNEEEVSLWAIRKIGDSSGLFFITNNYQAVEAGNVRAQVGKKWTSPLQMHPGIEEFTSIKGKNLINQLFLFGDIGDTKNKGLIHFWQDKETTHWEETPIGIKALNKVKEVDTYTIDISFACEDKLKVFNEEVVTVLAESNMLVYLNNKKYLIGPHAYVDIPIRQNSIKIVYPTTSIAASKIILYASFLITEFEVDTTHKLKERIKAKANTAEDIKKARKEDGTPLVPNNPSYLHLGKVAATTSSMLKIAEDLGAKNRSATSASPSIARYSTGIGTEIAASRNMASAGSLDHFMDGLGHSLGSIWHSIKKGFAEFTSYIVEKVEAGVKFLIEIGGKVYHWVAEKAEQVLSFLEKVWEQMKVTFKDLVDFFGFIFKWDDIIATKNAMEKFTLNAVDALSNEIENMKQFVNHELDKLTDGIRQSKFDILKGKNLTDDHSGGKGVSKSDPKTTWLEDKVAYLGDTESDSFLNHLPKEITQPFLDLLQALAGPLQEFGDQLVTIFKDIGIQFGNLFSGDLDIGDFLKYLALAFAELGLDAAKMILTILFNSFKLIIKGIKSTLTYKIEIPFFSFLFEAITGNKLAFSILEIVCLIIAIPTTVAYKIGVGKAPFDEKNIDAYIESGNRIFSLQRV